MGIERKSMKSIEIPLGAPRLPQRLIGLLQGDLLLQHRGAHEAVGELRALRGAPTLRAFAAGAAVAFREEGERQRAHWLTTRVASERTVQASMPLSSQSPRSFIDHSYSCFLCFHYSFDINVYIG